MAELRNEECKGGKDNPSSASCGCGNPKAVQGIAMNSIRGAAIALAMNVDELRELLGSKGEGDAAKLRVQIAELKSENERLREEVRKFAEANKALSEFVVIKW
jgi:FtsZ-binding cell division protein ZapB